MKKQEEPKKNGGDHKVIIGKNKFVIDTKKVSKEDLDALNDKNTTDEDKILIVMKYDADKGKKDTKNEKESIIIPFSYKNSKGETVDSRLEYKTIFYIDGKKYEIQDVIQENNKQTILANEVGTTNNVKLSVNSFKKKYSDDTIKFEETPIVNPSPLINMEKTELDEFVIDEKDSLTGNKTAIKKGDKIYKREDKAFVEYKVEKVEKLKGKKTPIVTLKNIKEPALPEKIISTNEFINEYKDEKIKVLASTEEYQKYIDEKKATKPLIKKIITPTTTKPKLTPVNKFTPGSRNETIKNIGDLLKIGVDRVVIHGDTAITKEDGSKYTPIKPDTDVLGALYLLNNSFGKNKKPNIKYNKGSYTEIIEKGGKSEIKNNNEVVLHIDVGGKKLSVEKNGETTNIYIDHHAPEKTRHTSATSMIFDILNRNGLLKEKPIWINSFVDFVDKVDNLSYVDRETKDKKKEFDKDYFLKQWPKSLQGIYDQIPFPVLISIFEKYPTRNPMTPFTKKELDGEIVNTKFDIYVIVNDIPGKKKRITKTIRDICNDRAKSANFTGKCLQNAIDASEKRGMETENDTLGKFVYHDFVKYEGEKKLINTIPNDLAFLATKAYGYDSFVSYNKEKKKFFINSTTIDLTKIHEKINKIIPNTQIVRGVFIFPPINYSEIKETLTEEQFKECLDIKTTKTTIPKKGIEEKTEPKKIEEPKEKPKKIEYSEDYLERMIIKYEGRPILQDIFIEKLAEIEKKNGKKEPKKDEKKENLPTKTEEKVPKKEEKKELPKVNEIEVKKLEDEFNQSRERYITEYKKSLESKKSTTMVGRWFNKIHDSIFGAKIKEDEISANLKKNKEEWDTASEKYQRILQEKYKAEFLKTNDNEVEANRYAKGKILGDVVLKNIWETRKAEAEKWPPEKKTIMGKIWEAWRKTSRTKKVLLSCGIFATAGLLGGMAVGALMTGVTWKVARSAFSAQAAHLVDRSYKKDENKKDQSLDSLRTEFIEGTMDAKTYKNKYEAVIEQEKKANRKRLLVKTGIAFAIGAGTMVATEIYDNLHEIGAPVGTVIQEPTEHFSSDAIIRKNEGIEHAFRRQIENDPALKTYFEGKDSGVSAHIAAQKLGYVDGHGGEVRVSMPGVGYKLEVDTNGNLISHEIDTNGKLIENHHQGDNFESTPDKQEYEYNKSASTVNTNEPHHDQTTESYAKPDTTTEIDTDTETKLNELPFDDQVAIRVRTDIDNYFTKHTGLTTIAGPDTETWKTLSTTDSWTFMKTLTSKGYDDPQIYGFGEYFYHLAKEYNFTDENSLKGKTVAEIFETLESKAQENGFK